MSPREEAELGGRPDAGGRASPPAADSSRALALELAEDGSWRARSPRAAARPAAPPGCRRSGRCRPGRTLCRKMISSFHSRTATWKFVHARQPLGQRGQLVIVRGEEHLGPAPALVQLLGHRPRDREAVEGARCRGRPRPGARGCARVAWCRMLAVSTISTRNVLCPRARLSCAPDAREDAIRPARCGAARAGTKRADLRQEHEQRDLAHEHALAAHVRAGEDDDLAPRRVERDVVGGERGRAAASSTGWRPSHDLERVAVVHLGPHVAALAWRHLRERGEHVERATARAVRSSALGVPPRPRRAPRRTARARARPMRSSAPRTRLSYSFSSAVT